MTSVDLHEQQQHTVHTCNAPATMYYHYQVFSLTASIVTVCTTRSKQAAELASIPCHSSVTCFCSAGDQILQNFLVSVIESKIKHKTYKSVNIISFYIKNKFIIFTYQQQKKDIHFRAIQHMA